MGMTYLGTRRLGALEKCRGHDEPFSASQVGVDGRTLSSMVKEGFFDIAVKRCSYPRRNSMYTMTEKGKRWAEQG